MTATLRPQVQVSVAGQEAFASYVADAVIFDAVGMADGNRCVGEPPSARYFLGALAPGDLDLSAGGQLRGRETANSAGFDFEVSDAHGTISVRLGFSLYYRVFPTLAEQLSVSGEQAQGAEDSFPIAVVFKRLEMPITEIHLPLDAGPHTRHGEDSLSAALAAARRLIASDETLYRRNDPRRSQAPRVPGAELVDDDRFRRWCDAAPGDPVLPEWKCYISIRSRTTVLGSTRVSLRFVNDSSDPTIQVPGRRRGTTVQRHDDDRDHFVFRTTIVVAPGIGHLRRIRMNLGPDAYRYNPHLAAYAANCGVECDLDREENVLALRSTWAPRWQTFRLESRPDDSTDFRRLADRPIEALRDLAGRLEDYANSPSWSLDGLSEEQALAKQRDREAFLVEVGRFRGGLRWLEQDERLLLAFRLANRTMTHLGTMTGSPFPGWYLFQLVFIVSQLPSLAWREHPESSFEEIDGVRDPTASASVLWFPTGGGKTEAYLGLTACAMFYDRARGKGVGVTAWCRLPLRLLTLQATQRQVAFVAAADEVRNEAAAEIVALGGHPGDRFQVGVFMGDTSTPNSISRDAATVRLLRDDEERRNRYRVVDKCPYCRARAVSIRPPDPTDLRLVHECTACTRVLPVIVTDSEIYRYLPTFIVGTVDKLATMGLTDKFGAILGDVDGECSIHGFGRGGKCIERRAPDHPRNTWRELQHPLYDASPSLEILDELHMLREEFGVFDGHYESSLANIQRELSARARADGRGVRMKVIATTATIKGEDRQCDHLLGLRSVAMPLPGPSLDESFYWGIKEDPLREFIGILPQRTTAEQALVRILLAFHKAIRRLDADGQSADQRFETLDPEEFLVLRDLYRVSLTYVTSLLDFGKVSRSVETQVNHDLRRLGLREVKTARISADAAKDGIGAIRAIVDDLEKPIGASEYEAVLATAMVAHGVDIERLNVMIFNGMPKSMAEYIQASSRVGRKYLGVVFTVFNPIRERDRSHFRYHGKFHEYLDRMVEPVAINRWSRYAARRTFPGVLMSEILQNGNRGWWDAGHEPRHLHDLSQSQQASRPAAGGGIPELQESTLIASMDAAFLAARPEAVELRAELTEWTSTALATIRAAGAGGVVRGNGRSQYRATGDHLGQSYAPMTSLRDVEEDVPIVVLDRRAR